MSTTSLPNTERGLLVAAVRQLLADGWNLDRMRSADGLTALHYDEIGMYARLVIVDQRRGVRHQICPESIAQVVDFLVVAKVLPRRFAFWSPPLPSRPMHIPADCPLCSDDLVSVTE